MMRKVFVLALLAGLSGCAWAHARLTYEFVPLAGNSQILYEPGAEDLANRVDAHWLTSVERVERRQYLPFKDVGAIRVYVFNDRNRYADFSRASVLTRGSSSANAVYLSGKLRERIDTLPGILVHELSHAHVRQHTGTFRYVTDLPGWFLEGLAVAVSAGGGAENVTAEQAWAAMREGRRFEPADAGRWIGHRSARSYGLDPHTYYRQAGMFVEHLRTAHPAEFEAALRGVLNGDRFRDVWTTHYGREILELWQDYEKSIGAQDDAPPMPAGHEEAGGYLVNSDAAVEHAVVKIRSGGRKMWWLKWSRMMVGSSEQHQSTILASTSREVGERILAVVDQDR